MILQAARDQLAAFINPRRRIGSRCPAPPSMPPSMQGVRKGRPDRLGRHHPSVTQAAYCTGLPWERAA